ncbi:MAG TPA: aspartate kinase [Kofleriaceae bacterium]|nr:aspartate kinase [Kofleriaceae bacterium]
MKVVVQKYGGSSVADPVKLGLVADRVARTVGEGSRVVVVVSAMGKTTDELLALARTVAPESSGGPQRRELDMLLSVGERISMALLAMALEARGILAISFTGSQSGILTNDRHSGARIIEVRPVRIEDELERGRVVIVAGFQGMSYKREITTLGRGGSDTTAVALAAALGADCEIYSDVDGVYSADPRVVPEATRLPAIGYEEMQELAAHGAKVMNAQAVEWARKAGVIIHARATAGGSAETTIGAVGSEKRGALAVTGTRSVTRITGGRDALAILADEAVALRHACPACIRLVRDDVPDWARVERKLVDDGARVSEEGEVTVVGPGVGGDPALLRRVLALADPVLGHDAAPLRLSVQVAGERVDAVTRALHAALCA